MKRIVLKKTDSGYFTNLKDFPEIIEKMKNKYNWLISDYECNTYPSQEIPFEKEVIFLRGEELANIVKDNEIQFIWGVFSAFKKCVHLEEVLEHPIPYVKENEELWKDKICFQNPLADIEIVAWDSALVVIITKNEKIIDIFKEKM